MIRIVLRWYVVLMLVLAAGFVFAGATSESEAAKPMDLMIIGHAVHQRVSTTGDGGDLVAEWTATTGVTPEWVTLGVTEIHERLFREAELKKGQFDVAYILNRFVSPNIANLFEPLDAYQAKDPIENFDGISAGMKEALTFDGNLFAIPFRHATHGLHYNEELLAERGLDGPPKTFEELIEYAEKLTYTRDDGTQVHGFIMGGTGTANIIDVVRVFGGDFITDDLRVVANEKGMVAAITLLADFFQKGILPKIFLNFTTEDVITFMQQGRAAMAIGPFGRNRPFNDAEKSNFPGKIQVTAIPSFSDSSAVAAAKTEFWAMSIPKNAENKEMAWSLIKYLSSEDATVREAINGNGPVRSTAYQDARVQALVPYWAAEAAAVEVARVPLPGFEGSAKVDDIGKEEIQAALLGIKTPQKAMDDLDRRVEEIMSK